MTTERTCNFNLWQLIFTIHSLITITYAITNFLNNSKNPVLLIIGFILVFIQIILMIISNKFRINTTITID